MGTPVPGGSLQALLDRVPSVVDHLYRNPKGALRSIFQLFPPAVLPPEFTNWRDEQRARRESVALLDQSFHMSNLSLRGPDALRLLESLAINSFRDFGPGRAKQFVVCSPEGYVIGDNILYELQEDAFVLVGSEVVQNWVTYHAETGGSRVSVERDPAWSVNPTGRRTEYRFQVEGPKAFALLEVATGGPLPDVRFFHWTWLVIAGRKVRALRHSMAGVPGMELSGPWEDREAVRTALVEAGRGFGLREVGSFAYLSSGGLESGWVPNPLPAIYTSPEMRAYREWLPASGQEAMGSLGGSFYSSRIEDYYLTPWELGYEHILKFDHDFVGRQALLARAQNRHRRKVTLVWHPEDTARAFGSLLRPGPMAKYMDIPWLHYATWQYDKVLSQRGEPVGIALYAGYTSNERAVVALAVVDEEHSRPGTEVVLVWGEDGGGTRSGPWVEPHAPVEIRATVAPVPISRAAREYRAAMRSGR
ncbi:MAG: aminomethyl transferase family protein [Armatimonadota bacterium]|nr:aminomethyl transferase family protein [Armatimonadota bacterium]MDR7439707.1 aminomethyl transferase family protein [Armatimonadota bacterium]MDR7562553.1 aminomethyl transferase family protein [Armatimonadota bacterium]MDR7566887.1 aminomethyl transferase family protein [Armatimonadota bacterium]MDR7602440.1 aminomethyl transferase family protein [Armatimonadota bacterium]